jgi:hypothetical protein
LASIFVEFNQRTHLSTYTPNLETIVIIVNEPMSLTSRPPNPRAYQHNLRAINISKLFYNFKVIFTILQFSSLAQPQGKCLLLF